VEGILKAVWERGARYKNTKELAGHRFPAQLQLQEMDGYKSVIDVGFAETISTLSSKDASWSTPSRRRFPEQTADLKFDSGDLLRRRISYCVAFATVFGGRLHTGMTEASSLILHGGVVYLTVIRPQLDT